MLSKIKDYKEEGFTIIEVLIVLAIAGLIMVVVFLAVPALQRNARNNSRKTEANNIASAVSEVQGNKGGSAIVAGDQATIIADTKLNFYKNGVSVKADATTKPTTSTVIIIPGFKCDDVDPTVAPAATTTNGRSTAVWYAVETGSGGTTGQQQCLDIN